MIIGLKFSPIIPRPARSKHKTITKIMYECDQCHKTYEGKYQSDYLSNRRFTLCSRKCMQESRKTGGVACDYQLSRRDMYKWHESMVKTSRERYGVDNPSSSEIVKERRKRTFLERWGVKSLGELRQRPDVAEKAKQTCVEHYGVDNPLKSDVVRKRVEQTCLKRYGVTNPFASSSCKDKIRMTCLRRYNVAFSMQSEMVKNKARQTMLERFGVPYAFQSEVIKRKSIETNMKKYGCKYTLQSREIRDKIDWGACVIKRHKTMKKNGSYGKSIIEDRFYERLCQQFSKEDVERQVLVNGWSIDFHITSVDVYIQFDGVYWHGLDRSIEQIREFRNPRDVVIESTFLRDQAQNLWFHENGFKLIRVTDVGFSSDPDGTVFKVVGV